MPRAQGARALMAFAFEGVYGTPPGSGFRQVPFVSTDLGGEQPLLDNEVLGFGRDPLAPSRDAFNADGSVVIPMDVENLGLWLKATFGQPVTTASVAATGGFTFSAQPVATSTITVAGTAFTFVASGAVGNQCNIGASLAATMTALAVVLNASVVPAVAAATYTATATGINIAFDALGHAGNAFTLAASTTPASNATPSGATLSGGANDHTFTSGGWTLPSVAVETQMPEVPRFSMYSGAVVDELSWEMKRAGLLQATVKLIAQGESVVAASVAGSLSALNYKRFGHFNGSVLRDGVAIANITQARVNYMNNLERIDAIRGDGRVEGVDPSIAALKGQIVTRFSDLTLFNQAIAGSPCALQFSHTISPSEKFVFTAHAVYLPRPRVPIEGPGGVEATFDWQAALATSPARMATAVLTNGVAAY
ncbi:tail tube protein [Rhodobacter phage RcKemmy]|nr:tail tube protein [Rhodobacter phage RcKemmy]